MLLKSKAFFDYARQEATQTTIKNVSLKSMRMFPVPLPPLAEQKRIVAKLEELLPLCEVEVMTNDEYFSEIGPKVDTLTVLSTEALSLCQGIIGRSLTKEDFYFSASANRCINLIYGFVDMLQTRNLTCAGVLLRMQMDNCMRTYAAFIAKDCDAVVDCIIQGGKVSDHKDRNGKKMSDGYLKGELSKLDSVFADVYDQASGYVHLSEKAFYQMVASCEDYKINFYAGPNLLERHNPFLIEAAEAFIHFVKLHFKMLEAVAESKERLDATLDR